MARPLIAVLNACITLALAQQECPDTNEHCPGYYSGLSRSGTASLAVTCSQTHINVTIIGWKANVSLKLLEYVCNSSNNVTCSYFSRGTFPLMKEYSAVTSLQPGTKCVVFGCYHTSGPTRKYAFNEINCSVPAHSSVTPSLDLTPSTSVDLTLSTSMDLTPSTSVDLTPSTSVNLTPSNSMDFTSTTSMGTVTLVVSSTSNTILIIIGSVVIILAVLGSVLFLIIIVKKIRRGKAQNYTELLQWIDSNYKPVKITGVAGLSLSLATLIESLENTQKDCAKEQTCKDSPKMADSSPTHTAEKSDMVEEISPCHSAEQKDSSPPFGTNSEPSDSNSSLPSSFTKEQEIVDVSITDSSQQNAMSLESEVTYDTDLSSYTSEVSQY